MFNKRKLLSGLDKFTRENPNANGTRFTSKHKWASARTMKKCQINIKRYKSTNELEREMNGVL